MYKFKEFELTKMMSVLGQRSSWLSKNNVSNPPNGTKAYPSHPYSRYNVVWIDPSNPLSYVKEFIMNNPSIKFSTDLSDLKSTRKSSYDRAIECINDLRAGNFVYTDNDSRISKNINNSNDIKSFNWDTRTHWIRKESSNDYLLYSKDITDGIRLTYKIYKPKEINGKWICSIELDRCSYHKTGNKSYGKARNTLESIANISGDASKLLSDTNYKENENN